MGDINTNIRINNLETLVECLEFDMRESVVHIVNQYSSATFDKMKEWLTNDELVVLCIKKTTEMWISYKVEVTNTKITFYFVKDDNKIFKMEMLKNGGWQSATDAGYMFIPTPTENDTGAVLTATGEGTVEWAL